MNQILLSEQQIDLLTVLVMTKLAICTIQIEQNIKEEKTVEQNIYSDAVKSAVRLFMTMNNIDCK